MTLAEILPYSVPIQDSLLSNLEICDIIALSHTCRALSDLYSTTLKAQFNIKKHLQHYFSNPNAFRVAQASSNALIAGMSAIEFFRRRLRSSKMSREFPGMTILVEKGKETESMQAFLLNEGYQNVPDPSTAQTQASPVERALMFEKKSSTSSRAKNERECVGSDVLTIRLLVTHQTPLYALLTFFHFTSLLNFITATHAYSLLPFSTFIRHESFFLGPFNWNQRIELDKSLRFFRDEGFRIESVDQRDYQIARLTNSTNSTDGNLKSRVDLGPRRVGDQHSWVIPLSPLYEPIVSPLPARLTTHSEFCIRSTPSSPGSPIDHYKLHSDLFLSPSLRYPYIVLPRILDSSLYNICYKRYDDLALLGMEMMQPESRPTNYALMPQLLVQRSSALRWNWKGTVRTLKPPHDWIYYDDEITELLRLRWGDIE